MSMPDRPQALRRAPRPAADEGRDPIDTPPQIEAEPVVEAPAAADVSTVKTPAIEQEKTPAPKPASTPEKRPGRKTTERASTAAPAPVDDGEAATAGVSLRCETSLDNRLTAYNATSGLSYPMIVMQAIQSTYADLPTLLEKRAVHIDVPDNVPNLFGLPAVVTKKSENATEPKHTRVFKVSRGRKDTLDQLVIDLKAPSLNELMVTALDAFLPVTV